MKFTSIFSKLAATAVCAMSLITANAYAIPAFNVDPYALYEGDSSNYNFALDFTAKQAITVDALAYFFYSADFSGSHAVALFDMSGNKLAETIVDTSDALIGNFRYSSINPINLLAGATYRIIGMSTGGMFDVGAQSVTADSAISFVQSGYSNDIGNPAPDFNAAFNFAGPVATDSYWGPSLSFNLTQADVPEPATYALFAAGLGLLLISRRRKSS